jgi:hypothetical protein
MLDTVRDPSRPHSNAVFEDPAPDIEGSAVVIQAADNDVTAFFSWNHVTWGMTEMFQLGISASTVAVIRQSALACNPWTAVASFVDKVWLAQMERVENYKNLVDRI